MQNAIKELINSITKDRQEKKGSIYPAFKDKRYTPCRITTENIRQFTPCDHSQKISAIDGGNIEIIKSPDTSLHLVRLYFNIFKNNIRQTPKTIPQRIDFYALAQSFQKDTDIYYKTKLIPLNDTHKKYLPDEKDLIFDSYDPTITTGIFRTPISKIGEISRKFAEWNISRYIIDHELKDGDILLRDGALQTAITNETTYADAAYACAETKNITYCALSKTSTLLATNAKTLASAITEAAGTENKNSTWLYNPLTTSTPPDHKAAIYYVHLNKNSDYTFRFEIYEKQNKSAQKTIEQLAHNSRDMTFPGYPYTLIDADKNARVTFKETSFHKTYIDHYKNKNKSALETGIRATDAHDLLNKIV